MSIQFRRIFFKTFFSIVVFLSTIISHAQHQQLTQFTLQDGLPQSQVNAIIQDTIGYLWIGTHGGGISRYDGSQFKTWDEKSGLNSNYVYSIKLHNGNLFIGTQQGLVIKSKQQFTSYNSPQVNKIIAVDNRIYLATNKGIMKYISSGEILRIDIEETINQSQIIDINYDGKFYWITTSRSTYKTEDLKKDIKIVEVLDEKENSNSLKTQIETLPKTLLLEHSVPKSSIHTILDDNQSNTWIGTSKGLYKLTKSSFKHYFNGRKIKAIQSVKKDVLVAISSNELVEIDSTGNYRINAIDNKITAISTNKKEIVYAATDYGIVTLDSLKVKDTVHKNLLNINKLIVRNDKIWVARKNKGITSFFYDASTLSIFNYLDFGKSDGIYDLSINDMVLDGLNRLWYVSKQGFFGYIEDDIAHHLGKKLNINASINTIIVHDNRLFVGTQGKGIWYSEVSKELKFHRLRGDKQLYSNTINQLVFDKNNNLWSGTQKGVDRIDVGEDYQIKNVAHFGKNDGFKGIETVPNAITTDSQGNIWFGTLSGLTQYKFSEIQDNKTTPSLYLERIEVVYNSVDSINLLKWTNSNKVLKLQPTQNHISFSFRTVDLNYPNEVQYSWRLENEEWSSWSDRNEVEFASLDAGKYNFQVQSRTINWKESKPISFRFKIGKQLIEKLWFKTLLISILLVILILVIINYLRNLKIKNAKVYERLEMENNLLSLEQKALRLQMNPHFIFNVLNGIKSMGNTDTDKMNSTINKFATLLRMTLHNSRKDHISLEEEIKTLKNYIEVEQLMHEKSFTYVIDVGSDLDTEEILIPPMLVQPFVENAIRHGILPLEREGALKIEFEIKNNELHCIVEDNGVGVFHSQKKKTATDHQSMALRVTKERIESISGKNSFKIEELQDEYKRIKGTKIWFKIPLLTDY